MLLTFLKALYYICSEVASSGVFNAVTRRPHKEKSLRVKELSASFPVYCGFLSIRFFQHDCNVGLEGQILILS